jgi:hypothetical protein
MFVRFRQTARRLQVSLTATRWDGGRVRHEHLAGLGSVPLSPSATDRIAFWTKLHQRLGALSNRVDAAQREAILKIMSGEDSDPFATVFAVLASTLTEAYDPIFAPIEFDVDVDARKGRFVVAGVAECVGEPIKNPVTGAEHRARIDIPHGFEYEIAEMGSGTATTQGKIQLKLKDSYGQFARLHLNNHGVVKNRAV